MKVGFIGLGKMGGNMTKRLVAARHDVVAYDLNESARKEAETNGAQLASSRSDLVGKLEDVIVWLMIPAQYVDQEISDLLDIVGAGAVIIDGGNSDFRLSKKRYELCKERNVSFVDVGTSGGILGLKNGYSIMVGGDEDVANKLSPIFSALSPSQGWGYFGQSGSGHYVKMVHNAIEYGLMQSYAEGYRMLKDGPYKELNLGAIGDVWAHGSIISSLLNDLTVEALKENPELVGIEGFVAESGETRWTLEIAQDHGVELPAIEAAYKVRLDSQAGKVNFGTKLLAAMRNKFGGHAINKDHE